VGEWDPGRGLQAALPAAKILSPVFRLRRLPEEPPKPEHRWDVEAALRLNTVIGDPVLAARQVIRRLERPMEKLPMTSEGYARLEAELKHRQQVERPRIIQQITDARTHGDLSENAEYHAAKESQSINESHIAELEDKLARAEVIDVSKLSGDTIKFGATVTLVDEDTDEKKVWQIVGEPEADAKKGKISITSPVARALIGKTKGANVEVVTPGGAKAYEIKKVEWR
jgi:transcription elongation factor GreA